MGRGLRTTERSSESEISGDERGQPGYIATARATRVLQGHCNGKGNKSITGTLLRQGQQGYYKGIAKQLLGLRAG